MNETEEFVKLFCRPLHFHPKQYLLDGFDSDFCLVFDCDDDPESPETEQTCDICIVKLPTNDILSGKIRIIPNANRHVVMRILATIGIYRFGELVQTAWSGNSRFILKDNGGSMPAHGISLASDIDHAEERI